jgi:hypothetical protein
MMSDRVAFELAQHAAWNWVGCRRAMAPFRLGGGAYSRARQIAAYEARVDDSRKEAAGNYFATLNSATASTKFWA